MSVNLVCLVVGCVPWTGRNLNFIFAELKHDNGLKVFKKVFCSYRSYRVSKFPSLDLGLFGRQRAI